MGLQGVPNRCPSPIIELYSAMRMFLSSGPLSLLTRVGRVPLRMIQHANIRRVSFAVILALPSRKTPWQRQQM